MSTPLVVVGDYAWDVLIRANSELLTGGDIYGEVMLAPGGSAANVAVWARRCGLEASFIGKVGRDRFGELAGRDLADEGIEAHLALTDAQRTGSVAVWIDHNGQRSMVSGKGADHHLLPSELPTSAFEGVKHVHLTAWSFFTDPPRAAARRAACLARAAGATLSFDPGSFQMIETMGVGPFLAVTQDLSIDLLFPNHEEGSVLTGEQDPVRIARALERLYQGAVVALKLDADGAMILRDGVITEVPPSSNDLLDATGAGDAFAGAYLSRALRGADAVDAARFATRVSEWVIGRVGARPPGDAALTRLIG